MNLSTTDSTKAAPTEPTQAINERTASAERRSRLTVTAIYYASFIALGLCTASFGPTLPGLAEHTSTRLSEISFLFTARSLGYLCGSLLGGRLYDRVRGHPLMAVALLSIVTMLALTPIVPHLWLLTLVLLLLGLSEGTLDVGVNTVLVWVHRHNVPPFMNGLHFFFGVGSFLAPIIIAQLVLISGDITWAYWALALLIAPVIPALLRLPSPRPYAASTASHQPITAPTTNYKLVALIALFFFLYVGGEVGFANWLYTYTLRLNLGDAPTAAYLNSAFWGALTLGRLLSIPIAARFSPRTVMTADMAGGVLSIAIILLWPASITALWIGTLGLGFSIASLFPTTLSFAERRMHITGKVNGWFFAGSAAGGMLVPWLIGQWFESAGPHVAMQMVAADLVMAVVIFILLILYSNRIAPATHEAVVT